MSESFDVVVVGFGPVGAVCTALLGRLGARTLAIDRARGIYDKPRAFALDHEIMRVIQNLGIAREVAAHVAPFAPAEYYGVDGRLIKRLGALAPPYPLGWTPSMVFSQPPVDTALRRCAAGEPTVEIALGTELAGFAQSLDEVTLQLRDDAGKERTVGARYVIGCDGASSTVRGLLGIQHEDLEFDESWLVIDALVNERGAARLPRVCGHYCEPARPSSFLIGPGNHRRWEIMLSPGEDPRAMESGTSVWRLLSRWIGPEDATLWRAASYRFHALVAREWRRGRVFIAGDAAHQQPPFTGQGMCQGIRDVANLTWKLSLVLAGTAGAALLDTYEEERRLHVKRLTTVVREIGRIVCERDPEAARARDARLIAEAGGEVRTVPRQDLIPPLEAGLLSPFPHPANGTLFPQPRVRVGGEDVLLDEVAGTGFRIVVSDVFPLEALPLADLLATLSARVIRVGRRDHQSSNERGVLAVAETEGVLGRWYERHGCSAAIVRPDHCVYGVARTVDALNAQLKTLAYGLSGSAASSSDTSRSGPAWESDQEAGVNGADQIGDSIERRAPSAGGSDAAAQPLSNDV